MTHKPLTLNRVSCIKSLFQNIYLKASVKTRESSSRFEVIMLWFWLGTVRMGRRVKGGIWSSFPGWSLLLTPSWLRQTFKLYAWYSSKDETKWRPWVSPLSIRGDKDLPLSATQPVWTCMCNLVPLQPLSVRLWISNGIICWNSLRCTHKDSSELHLEWTLPLGACFTDLSTEAGGDVECLLVTVGHSGESVEPYWLLWLD